MAVTASSESAAAAARARKPKLVLFRWAKPGLPRFIQQHLSEQVRCLEHHFDVAVIGEDCDYVEVCETHQPDLAVFESGVYAGPRRITRTSAFPDVPKVGFCNADAYCATRSVFLSDMERWGVDTYFTLAVSMAEYTPDIADRLFVWPNFVDENVYRDYGVEKNIPLLFTGSQAPHYPWRSRINTIVASQFPCMTTPHTGWFDDRATGRMVQGAGYAQLLNAALIAPACGTIAKDVIRKHFEIPASRTCLVTERTASIEAAGFVDMENAVFADADNIVEKLEFLFAHPEELHRITDNGFKLVHSRHTMQQRDEFLQWLRLYESAEPGERVVQTAPFEPLRLVPASSGVGNSHAVSGGLDRALLAEGERLLELGRLSQAEELFLRCLNYHFMPEPVLGLTRCHLYGGNPADAVNWVTQSIERGLRFHDAPAPDPVEWAVFVRALLCQGRVNEAVRRADQYPGLQHPELDRIRQLTYALSGRDQVAVSAPPVGAGRRGSVHLLPERNRAAWYADLCTMLRACGQVRLAAAVSGVGRPRAGGNEPVPPVSAANGHEPRCPPPGEVLPLVSRGLHVRAKRRLMRTLGARHRRMTAGTPQGAVESLAQKEDIQNALLIGTSATSKSTRALLTGLLSNPNQPDIVWLHDATPSLLAGRSRRPGRRVCELDGVARKRARDRHAFDVVVVGKHQRLTPEERETLDAARFVVLSGINCSPTQRIHAGLIEDRDYALLTHDVSQDGGYSVFRRLSSD